MIYPVAALLTGRSAPFRGEETSAIAKQPVSGTIAIESRGLSGDEQADRRHHGGPHMAVHLYPQDHYAHWRTVIGNHTLLDTPGAFGENIAADGPAEDIACIGDRYRLGTALLEISQPRKPCWKIEHRFDCKGMVANIFETGRSGIYFRVLEPGKAQAGDGLEKLEQGSESWTVKRVFFALYNGRAGTSAAEFAEIASLGSLSPKLRALAAQRQG